MIGFVVGTYALEYDDSSYSLSNGVQPRLVAFTREEARERARKLERDLVREFSEEEMRGLADESVIEAITNGKPFHELTNSEVDRVLQALDQKLYTIHEVEVSDTFHTIIAERIEK